VIGGKPTPNISTISSSTFNQNFEIAILFNVVENSNIMSLRMTPPQEPSGEGFVSYAQGGYNLNIERVIV